MLLISVGKPSIIASGVNIKVNNIINVSTACGGFNIAGNEVTRMFNTGDFETASVVVPVVVTEAAASAMEPSECNAFNTPFITTVFMIMYGFPNTRLLPLVIKSSLCLLHLLYQPMPVPTDGRIMLHKFAYLASRSSLRF